jgi:hypothetical protein
MKKKIIGLFAIGLMIFNFSFKANKNVNENVTITNIALMQANAGELACDQKDNDECSIQTPSGIVVSRGFLRGLN